MDGDMTEWQVVHMQLECKRAKTKQQWNNEKEMYLY